MDSATSPHKEPLNNLSLTKNFGHRHDFIVQGNYFICSCGKKKLYLKPSEEGMLEGIMSNGYKYSVRTDRHRYFFPQEWENFIKLISNKKHYLFFLTLLHTGARAMEALHLKPINFNMQRQTITFDVVKQRKAKRQFYAIGKTRTFFVTEKYLKEIERYINKEEIADKEYLFLDNKILPPNYEALPNTQKTKFYQKTKIAYSQIFKRKIKESGVKDWKNFSLHNIRKTYGNWMRLYDLKMEEICYRLGHDINTYLIHYGSALIFTPLEKLQIMKILGEVK